MAQTFEDQLKQLESIVERLERGDLPLEESLVIFEQGIGLSDSCKKELDAAEGRVQVLLQKGNNRDRTAEDLDLS